MTARDRELRLPAVATEVVEREIAATTAMLDALAPGQPGLELAMAAMALPGFAEVHPLVPRDLARGALMAMRALADCVGERDGWASVSFTFGSAGAVRRAIFASVAERLGRRVMLVANAEAAASAHACGFEARIAPAGLAAFTGALCEEVAVAFVPGGLAVDPVDAAAFAARARTCGTVVALDGDAIAGLAPDVGIVRLPAGCIALGARAGFAWRLASEEVAREQDFERLVAALVVLQQAAG